MGWEGIANSGGETFIEEKVGVRAPSTPEVGGGDEKKGEKKTSQGGDQRERTKVTLESGPRERGIYRRSRSIAITYIGILGEAICGHEGNAPPYRISEKEFIGSMRMQYRGELSKDNKLMDQRGVRPVPPRGNRWKTMKLALFNYWPITRSIKTG